MHTTVAVGSSLLVLVFACIVLNKLAALPTFRYVLGEVPFIGKGAAVLSVLLPLAEPVAVLLLLFACTRLPAFLISALLILLLTIYLVGMILLVPGKPCSCGGVINGLGWWEHVGVNGFLIGVSAMGIRDLKRQGGNGQLAVSSKQRGIDVTGNTQLAKGTV